MRIEAQEKIKNGIKTLVTIGSKRFIRIQKFMVSPLGTEQIEWRRAKNNHLVKKDQYKILESNFEFSNEIVKTKSESKSLQITSSGYTMHHEFVEAKLPLTERIKEVLKEFESKYTKLPNNTVQDIAYSTMTPNKERLHQLNKFFKNNAERKKFILAAGRVMKEYGKLTSIKFIKELTGWGLKDSKMFMDEFVYVKKGHLPISFSGDW